MKEAEKSGAAAVAQHIDTSNDNAATNHDVQPEDGDVAMNIDEQTSSSVPTSTIPTAITKPVPGAALEVLSQILVTTLTADKT